MYTSRSRVFMVVPFGHTVDVHLTNQNEQASERFGEARRNSEKETRRKLENLREAQEARGDSDIRVLSHAQIVLKINNSVCDLNCLRN